MGFKQGKLSLYTLPTSKRTLWVTDPLKRWKMGSMGCKWQDHARKSAQVTMPPGSRVPLYQGHSENVLAPQNLCDCKTLTFRLIPPELLVLGY